MLLMNKAQRDAWKKPMGDIGKDSKESYNLAGKQLNRLTGGVSNKVSSGVKAGIKKLKDKFKF